MQNKNKKVPFPKHDESSGAGSDLFEVYQANVPMENCVQPAAMIIIKGPINKKSHLKTHISILSAWACNLKILFFKLSIK